MIYINTPVTYNHYNQGMASPYEDLSVTVFGEYSAEDRLTVTSFVWPTPNTIDTYTIAPNEGLSLELDKHFPVRLAKIALYDTAQEGSAELISLIVGEEVSEQMRNTPRVGQFIMNTNITLDNRLILAHIQAVNPSTPPALRRAVLSMLNANHASDTPITQRSKQGANRASVSGGGV